VSLFAAAARAFARSRTPLSLALRTLLAHAWFALNFFVAFPALVLFATGTALTPPPGPGRALAFALIALAHVPIVLLWVTFVREGRGTQAPFDPPRELVRRGLHRWVRNPMYLAYFAIVAGEALLYRSFALLAYGVAFGLLTHFYVVRFEEPALTRRFGEAYAAYCRRVPRWLPRRPR
jgi:protein-S-isoprenylcysteine O-methyltransferase Ste14